MPHTMERCQVPESGHHSPAAQRSQCQLVHVLLLWVSILTISQLILLSFFFTAGPHFLHHKGSDDIVKTADTTNNSGTSPGVQQHLEHVMVTFQVKGDNPLNTDIIWTTWKTNPLVETGAEGLTIKQDGSYFLYLQVTLGQREKVVGEHTVRLKRMETGEILLEGLLTNSKMSMFQGKSEILSCGDILVVTVHPHAQINITRTATYLGIFYQPKVFFPLDTKQMG